MIPEIAHIAALTDENRTTRTFVFDTSISAEPGQFLMLWLPGDGEKPISILRPDPLTVTVARVGPFSAALHQRNVGDAVGWRGPFGTPFTLRGENPLLIAGGYGVAPLFFLAQRLCEAGLSTTLAVGARTGEGLILTEMFHQIGCATILATDRGDIGFQGYVTQAVDDDFTRHDMVYACGPEPMLYAVAKMCWQAGIPGQVSLERYMKCGFGVCGQCAMDDKLVCHDGPVFDVEALRDSRDFGHFTRNATGRRTAL